MPTPIEDLYQRLDRLVDSILNRRCLPFLGAGISQQAKPRVDNNGKSDNDIPLRATDLAKKLAQALVAHGKVTPILDNPDHPYGPLLLSTSRRQRRDCPGEKNPIISKILSVDGYLDWNGAPRSMPVALPDGVPNRLEDVLHKASHKDASAEVPPLGEIAELCWATLGPTETVRMLRLDEWNYFSPTPAHHYLAVLVREGFLTEIFETNYDHFVERAVFETEIDAKGRGAIKEEENRPISYPHAPVIHDLGSYRTWIGKPRSEKDRKNLVRVVKLNGCAVAWTAAKEKSEPKEDEDRKTRDRKMAALDAASRAIGLTEEQLQGWEGRNWARDLLQVRARGHSLFFLGFAGSDPLVRHHVLAVLREFRESGIQNTGEREGSAETPTELEEWWTKGNAPFVMEFEPNLKFTQFQILRAFRDAHSKPENSTDPSDVYQNTFLGTDGPSIRRALGVEEKPQFKKLPADELLALVAARTVERHLIDKVLSRFSAVHAYLNGTLHYPDSVLKLVRGALSARLNESQGGASLWTTWMMLGSESEGKVQRSSAWATACFALRGVDAGRAGYRPFCDSPVKQPMFLVLLMLMRRATCVPGTPPLPSARELREAVVWGHGSSEGASPIGLRLTHRGRMVLATSHADRVLDGFLSDGHPPEVVLIALGRGTTTFVRQVRVKSGRGDNGHVGGLRILRVHVVGDLAALRGPVARDRQPLPDAVAHLRLLTEDPSAWTTRSDGWRKYCVRIA